MIRFEIPGKPQGKARARTVWSKNAHKIVSYTPENTMNYENLIKVCFLQSRPKGFTLIQSPVQMTITAYYRKAKGNKMIAPMLKPDADNICKCVLDSLNGLAYLDDKQVIDIAIRKCWSVGLNEKVTVELFQCDIEGVACLKN